MAKILCALYPDPVDGYSPRYARDDIPALRGYPDTLIVTSDKDGPGASMDRDAVVRALVSGTTSPGGSGR
jgi:hypothetical protein